MWGSKPDLDESLMTRRAVAYDIMTHRVKGIAEKHLKQAKRAGKAVTIHQDLVNACVLASRDAFERAVTNKHVVDRDCEEHFEKLMTDGIMRRQIALMLTCLRLERTNRGYGNPLHATKEDLIKLLTCDNEDVQFPLVNASRLNKLVHAFNDIGRTRKFTEINQMWTPTGECRECVQLILHTASIDQSLGDGQPIF